MNDRIFRWGVLVNLTTAVVGGLVLGGVWLNRPSSGQSSSGLVNHEHKLTWTDPNLRQQLSLLISAEQNMANSIKEFAQAQKELAAIHRMSSENGRYQQIHNGGAAEMAPQFFDTRTGEVKVSKP